ncbi:hypothetical protein N658DRAFT_135486 [Parathielavia hyrcaniae]|uniref:Uncharacterized protein n=1 Tax=Parathielavia hyrcaniae TaxID=113614 RepID=A0AAN6Q8Z2_9PEZI|nr:hypothetical protein N658DRAFT_135486 [Parathielavia hyrcaniae]
MELSSSASPQSPAPLALSELMAQITPRSDTTHPSDRPASIKQTSRPDAENEPTQSLVPDEPQTPSAQLPSQETSPPLSTEDEAPPTDWLATRQQLLPRRNQGKKADWIRGWSAAVSSHGDAAYCGCSEPMESCSISSDSRGRKGKTSAQFADSVRAAIQTVVHPSSHNSHKKAAVTTTTITAPSSPGPPPLCPHCSRPSSNPPPSTSPTSTSSGSSTSTSNNRFSKNFTKRIISGLLMRVRRPSRSQSAPKRDAGDVRNMPWPDDHHPRWPRTAPGQKTFLARPASQPLSAPVSTPVEKLRSFSRGDGGVRGGSPGDRVLSWFGREALLGRGRGDNNNRNVNDGRSGGARRVGGSGSSSTSSDLDGIIDSGRHHRRPGLSRSMSRLQRAAALLQRAANRPKD